MKLKRAQSGTDIIKVSLKYFDGEPVIKELKRVSTPGRRVYLGVDNLPRVRQRFGSCFNLKRYNVRLAGSSIKSWWRSFMYCFLRIYHVKDRKKAN